MMHDVLSNFSNTWMGKKLKVGEKLAKSELDEQANRAVAKYVHATKNADKNLYKLDALADVIMKSYLHVSGDEAKNAVIKALKKQKFKSPKN